MQLQTLLIALNSWMTHTTFQRLSSQPESGPKDDPRSNSSRTLISYSRSRQRGDKISLLRIGSVSMLLRLQKGLPINHLNTGLGTCSCPYGHRTRLVPVDNQHRVIVGLSLSLRLHDISIRYSYPYLRFFSHRTPVSPLPNQIGAHELFADWLKKAKDSRKRS